MNDAEELQEIRIVESNISKVVTIKGKPEKHEYTFTRKFTEKDLKSRNYIAIYEIIEKQTEELCKDYPYLIFKNINVNFRKQSITYNCYRYSVKLHMGKNGNIIKFVHIDDDFLVTPFNIIFDH